MVEYLWLGESIYLDEERCKFSCGWLTVRYSGRSDASVPTPLYTTPAPTRPAFPDTFLRVLGTAIRKIDLPDVIVFMIYYRGNEQQLQASITSPLSRRLEMVAQREPQFMTVDEWRELERSTPDAK